MKTIIKFIIIYLITFNNAFSDCLEGDCVSGAGSASYSDGRKYVGNFFFGEFSGKGTLTFEYGQKYVGNFKDGYFNGFGNLNGEEVAYFNGKLVSY